MKRLLVVVADADAEAAVREFIRKRAPNWTERVDYDVLRHYGRDPGCRSHVVEFVRPWSTNYARVLIVFDEEGSGGETEGAEQIELELEAQLEWNGWLNRCAVVVPSPELEAWVWASDRRLGRLLDLPQGGESPRALSIRLGFQFDANGKPFRPKEALDAVRRELRTPKSPSFFKRAASILSVEGCSDRAAHKLDRVVDDWARQS